MRIERRSFSLVSLLLAVSCSFSNSVLAEPSRMLVDGSIAATARYHGDFYRQPNGKLVKLYRKEGVYALALPARASKQGVSTQLSTLERLETHSNGSLKRIVRHKLNGFRVVKLDTGSAKQPSGSGNRFAIDADSLMRSVSSLQPVFTSASGQGDLLLLPKVTVQLVATADRQKTLAELSAQFSVNVVKQLELSGAVYSLEFTQAFSNVSSQFAAVRAIMQHQSVEWAEPQFFVQAQKSAFTPNDALFNRQWSLKNSGYRGSRCDADCDADNAWALDGGSGNATGAGTVIAIVDDGVQLDHPDLSANIFINTAEQNGTAGVDDDGNGRVDDIRGYDFVDDAAGTQCVNGQFFSDGQPGKDANPSPRARADCVLPGTQITVDEDNHGTAVAGIAAAVAKNSIGIAGVAYSAKILPVRAVSEFDTANSEPLCDRLAQAIEYAAQDADVINASWSLPIECTALTQAIERTTKGTVTFGKGSRRATGSPVVFASGNNASGWVKVTVPVTQGPHAFEWRYLRTDDLNPSNSGVDETVWLDEIRWSDGSREGFESISNLSGTNGYTTNWALNTCNQECDSSFGGQPVWGINTDPRFSFRGSRSARLNASGSDCGYSYLHIIKDGPAGNVSFWVWVSGDTQQFADKFELAIDGQEVLSYGDLAAFGFVDNPVAYPANLSDNSTSSEAGVIAVGASSSGDLSGSSSTSDDLEYRASYSQYGDTLDVVAPSSDQHLGITTTDRVTASGADTLGYNTTASSNDLSGKAYTQRFTGTSASAPMVAGIAAAVIASDPGRNISAEATKNIIRDTADKVGTVAYVGGRNAQFGFGRVNMFSAVSRAKGVSGSIANPTALPGDCAVESFDYRVANDLILPRYAPQQLAGVCPVRGPIPAVQPEEEDLVCTAVRARNGNVAAICF